MYIGNPNFIITFGVIMAGLGVAWLRVTISFEGHLVAVLMIISGLLIAVVTEIFIKRKAKNEDGNSKNIENTNGI